MDTEGIKRVNSFRFDVISLYPKAFETLKNLGVVGRALNSGIAELNIHNPRDFTFDKYKKVDDLPYGGGAGMVLKPEPYFAAYESIPQKKNVGVLLLTPQGKPIKQNDLRRWAKNIDQLILLCGQYEGFDERIRSIAQEEVSIGDFVLTGGEIPAMLILNGVIRLLPGTLGASESLKEESHDEFLLEHPQYTRPNVFRGMEVPDVLRKGNHKEIDTWRYLKKIERTKFRRPDLYEKWLEKNNM